MADRALCPAKIRAVTDATERFVEVMGRPEADVPLDLVSLLIAAHAYPDLDVDAELGRLDAIAAGCEGGDLDGLLRHLFVDLGFAGNAADYYDPRNSFLNEVLDRRTGLPITLSVLTIEIGRRLGIDLVGIGLPGHFLVRTTNSPYEFVDPFHGGDRLDVDGVQALFSRVFGPSVEFLPGFVAPVSARSVVSRMLANLQGVYLRRVQPRNALWTVRLRLAIPGLRSEERAELAQVLGQLGDVDAATAILEDTGNPDTRRVRSRWN
jgi:regulator of sirC expression with transglutaminase-like and TPR domain